jgi:hypothetical protein
VNDFWVCPACRSLNRERATECYSCHAPYAPFDASAAAGGSPGGPGPASTLSPRAMSATSTPAPTPAPTGAVLTASPNAGSPDAEASPPLAPTPPEPGLGLPGAIVGGAIGAIVSAAVWYLVVTATHVQAGIVAIAVGWIVGQAVVLTSGRRSLDLVAVSVAWTVAALVLAQYLIAIRLLNDLLAEAGADFQLPLFVSPGATIDVVVAWLQDDPLTLLFWAIALFEAVAIPWRRAMRSPGSRWSGRAGMPATSP